MIQTSILYDIRFQKIKRILHFFPKKIKIELKNGFLVL